MMGKEQAEKARLPGLEYERFEVAVEAMAALRDEGKFLVFLSHWSNVRFIGSPEDFRSRWASDMQVESVPEGDATEALNELRNFTGTAVAFGDAERLTSFLETTVFESTFSELDDAGKAGFRGLLQKKGKVVLDRLLSAALRQRAERLDTVTGPLLDDLDAEVVSERQDELTGRRVSTPFLRLRLRYSSRQDSPFPFALVRFAGGSLPSPRSRSFEFEADETDIDLLIRRLMAAKDLLLRTIRDEADRKEQ